jgi:hypothetical protein
MLDVRAIPIHPRARELLLNVAKLLLVGGDTSLRIRAGARRPAGPQVGRDGRRAATPAGRFLREAAFVFVVFVVFAVFVAFARSPASFARNFAMPSISFTGTGADSGNRIVRPRISYAARSSFNAATTGSLEG